MRISPFFSNMACTAPTDWRWRPAARSAQTKKTTEASVPTHPRKIASQGGGEGGCPGDFTEKFTLWPFTYPRHHARPR